jgi:hypothetical protein
VFEKEVMALKDARVTQLNEILQGIQIIKFFTWESKFIEAVQATRKKELSVILKKLIGVGSSMALWSMLGVTEEE